MHVLLIVLLASAALALPQAPAPGDLLESRGELQDRETPCVALGDCPGQNPNPLPSSTQPSSAPPPPSSTPPPPPSSIPPPSSTVAVATASPSLASAGDIGQFAVLGDSFASGVAWLPSKRYNYTDSDTCRRYFQAYGPQIEASGKLGPDAKLYFLACSGSKTDKVKNEQIPAIPPDSTFATVSVGGNDVGFFPVMDACVLRSNGNLNDNDCANELSATANRITNDVPGYKDIYSSPFNQGLTNKDFKFYIMGYPHFFNVDTDQCDGATFAYYKDSSGGPFLTKNIRNKINGLIQQMNDAIRSAIAATNNPNIIFVDISPFFNGHRFCEAGINEPYSGGIFTGIDDNAAWLYHFDWNPFHELNGQTTPYPSSTWACDSAGQADNDVGAILQCGLAGSGVTSLPFGGTVVENDGSIENVTLTGGDSGDPGQYGLFQRTFHPTHRGHQAIRDALLQALGKS